jgi:hypothetical protein
MLTVVVGPPWSRRAAGRLRRRTPPGQSDHDRDDRTGCPKEWLSVQSDDQPLSPAAVAFMDVLGAQSGSTSGSRLRPPAGRRHRNSARTVRWPVRLPDACTGANDTDRYDAGREHRLMQLLDRLGSQCAGSGPVAGLAEADGQVSAQATVEGVAAGRPGGRRGIASPAPGGLVQRADVVGVVGLGV